MKMHHLSPEKVEEIMRIVGEIVDSGDYAPDQMEKVFELSGVDGNKFLECKNHPAQTSQVNFEMNKDQGIRFFDPFNFYTNGIYKDMDGWSVWTMDQLKEPWS
ncbi:MAG: hypothetical protein GWM98_26340 [Nitrospinaceae bacterium]|nr:hypothetical protein [Nitrospinaceae bacterium]NIR57346.1 hypothetical protein [Nitrospinaceae bacterium]NIS87798.1 hypothetical protein [Nitrospinaceae bacterium]NIT84668.1 hypothetical protein [Nitrospinaceae bacterium]NIU46847.1 hypothetical protein [Nitrospinaceae bacterium]